jgi:hypothetical protein
MLLKIIFSVPIDEVHLDTEYYIDLSQAFLSWRQIAEELMSIND